MLWFETEMQNWKKNKKKTSNNGKGARSAFQCYWRLQSWVQNLSHLSIAHDKRCPGFKPHILPSSIKSMKIRLLHWIKNTEKIAKLKKTKFTVQFQILHKINYTQCLWMAEMDKCVHVVQSHGSVSEFCWPIFFFFFVTAVFFFIM